MFASDDFDGMAQTAAQTIQALIDAAVKAVDALAFEAMGNKDEIVKELLQAIADGHEFKDRSVLQ